jgi:hypothetical protein
LFDAGDPRRNANDDARLGKERATVHLLDEVAQHLLGNVEVCDDSVLQRADRNDVRRCTADHPLGLGPHGKDRAGLRVDRYDGRLVEDDPAAPHVHESVRGTEIDRHIAADELKHAVHYDSCFRTDARMCDS